MHREKITYTNYDGVEVTETFLFNLSEAEILEMEMTKAGGLSAALQRIIDAKDAPMIIKTFKDLLLRSYGVKSDDGRRFIKNEELSTEFSQTEAYSKMFMKLATDEKAAAEFVNNIIPQNAKAALDANNVAQLPNAITNSIE